MVRLRKIQEKSKTPSDKVPTTYDLLPESNACQDHRTPSSRKRVKKKPPLRSEMKRGEFRVARFSTRDMRIYNTVWRGRGRTNYIYVYTSNITRLCVYVVFRGGRLWN